MTPIQNINWIFPIHLCGMEGLYTFQNNLVRVMYYLPFGMASFTKKVINNLISPEVTLS